jgi:hypothetical protein
VQPHVRCPRPVEGVQYSGLRIVSGQALALLRRGEEVLVLPIDTEQAAILRRLSIGTEVRVSRGGTVQRMGGRHR